MFEYSSEMVQGRVALGIEYNGAAYKGWQRQAKVNSVQLQIEKALKTIVQQDVEIVCAGRTDAGVHATGQVIHFDLPYARPLKACTRGLNTLMPKDIAVTWVRPVPNDFHARFSAGARRYRYVIYNAPLRSGIFFYGVTHIYQELNADNMHQAAQALVGEQDFTSFRASHCQSNTPFRNIHKISVSRLGKYLVVDVTANAFLHHMVRNIVGSLVKIGIGEEPVDWMAELLALKDRTKAAPTAKPNGLYLVNVQYDSKYGLPETELGPLFLPDN